MNIIKKEDIPAVSKPEGIDVRYYLRDEYELHYNEQAPGSVQVWHHHEKICESLYIIEGELTAKWKIDEKEYECIVKAGDLIETENTPHSFINHTDKVAKFLVIKQVLSGGSKRDVIRYDKVLDEG